ncbi:hypothetical protein [Paraburkholderia strydomiana]|uniref:hypothetical protein n=1 Tax=Paraburkholderia strydomiana TaxID=1245417 RepID=UPI0038BB9AC3
MQHKKRFETERIVDAQCQTRIDLVTVEFDCLKWTGCGFANDLGIVIPAMSDLLGACRPSRRIEIPVRQGAGVPPRLSLDGPSPLEVLGGATPKQLDDVRVGGASVGLPAVVRAATAYVEE